MDETNYPEKVGRKPVKGGPPGEPIKKTIVKLWPSRWKRLGELVGPTQRSAFLRLVIEREIAAREQDIPTSKAEKRRKP